MQYKIRIATKQHEKRLMEMAKKLKNDPHIILPECRCKKCPFDKIKKSIDKLNDEKYLHKAAKGKDIVAALANTILLADEKRIPYLAFKKIGNENILYAKRGRVKDEYLVAIQNWDKPNLRLLAYADFAKKKKIYLFSMADKIVCDDEMPEDFIKFLKEKFECKEKEYIIIRWGGNELKLCRNGNGLAEIGQYFYYPPFWQSAEIDVFAPVIKCGNKCRNCIIEEELNKKPDPGFYVKGRQSDRQYIDNYKNMVRWAIEKKKIFVVNNTCYGDDTEKFIEILKPKEWEIDEIRKILEGEQRAIFLEQPSSAKLLEKYRINPLKLKEEWEKKKKEAILSSLPRIEGGKIEMFIDEIARIYNVEGKEGIIRFIKGRKMDVKEKAISYAFLLATNARIEEWKYSKMEKEFGEQLASYAEKVIKSKGELYKKSVEEFARIAGG